MQLIPLTPDLEEKASKGLIPEEEIAILDGERKPSDLFKKWDIDKLAKTFRVVISKYSNNGANEKYIRELILRFVGDGSDLNWGHRREILQSVVYCRAGNNKVEVVNQRDIINNSGSSNGAELKLKCPYLGERYVNLSYIIKHCCLKPEKGCPNHPEYPNNT